MQFLSEYRLEIRQPVILIVIISNPQAHTPAVATLSQYQDYYLFNFFKTSHFVFEENSQTMGLKPLAVP